MEIQGNLTFKKVRFDQDTDAHLVLNINAPIKGEARPRLCVIPLVDVSPSMEGDKFAYAKKSLLKLIEHLSAQDYCGLVKFSAFAVPVMRPVLCTVENKEELKRQVLALTLSGATNIASALLLGMEIANNMDCLLYTSPSPRD
jgi:uncharacterized protein with von Willebrand factor type A (vWA) domain